MIIDLERSGGFAGMIQHALIDTDLLEPDERQRLQELIESIGFFQSPSVSSENSFGIDRFQWVITIEREDQRHTVQINEGHAPPDWEDFLHLLQNLLRRARRQP